MQMIRRKGHTFVQGNKKMISSNNWDHFRNECDWLCLIYHWEGCQEVSLAFKSNTFIDCSICVIGVKLQMGIWVLTLCWAKKMRQLYPLIVQDWKKFFPMRMVKNWNNFSREVVGSSSFYIQLISQSFGSWGDAEMVSLRNVQQWTHWDSAWRATACGDQCWGRTASMAAHREQKHSDSGGAAQSKHYGLTS